MTASRPGQGRVKQGFVPGDSSLWPAVKRAQEGTNHSRAGYRNGTWRPDRKFTRMFGVQIVMRAEQGITKGDVLKVPMRFQTPTLNQLQRQYSFDWETFSTIRAGQKSRPNGRQLLALDVDTMLMNEDTAAASSNVQVWPYAPNPQRVINELNWISGYEKHSQAEIFRLVMTDRRNYGSLRLVNMLATITAVTATQNSGEPGAEYVTISFLEFDPDESLTKKQRPVSHGATTWPLQSGDTLYEIAKKSHFHRPSAWKTIAKANGITDVSPGDASELAAWAKKHNKTSIRIPAAGRQERAGIADSSLQDANSGGVTTSSL